MSVEAISGLSVASASALADQFEALQSGANVRMSLTQIKKLLCPAGVTALDMSTSTVAIDWTATKGFSGTLQQNTTFTFSGDITGEDRYLYLTQASGASYTATFPSGSANPVANDNLAMNPAHSSLVIFRLQ